MIEEIQLLRELIAIPRVSRDETNAANHLERWMTDRGLKPQRRGNNIWCVEAYDASRPTILLNAHIDTVKPVASWTRNPHSADIEGDRLYGLGSNDCGGGLVSLLHVYRKMLSAEKDYNLVYLASCEEEVSGVGGIRSVLPDFTDKYSGSTINVDVAIVGEPTGMQPAIAEKGLMVVDGVARGKSGHAARNEGVNAIYQALDDLVWLRQYSFEKVSTLLGPTKMQVTVLNAGTQHNVVPDECRFTIDIRTNEFYRNEEVFDFLCQHCKSELKARSFHLSSSRIDESHPIIQRCKEMGLKPFGSPTLSDQALMRFPSFKLGPGESSRSHSADEYICLSEIHQAISTYLAILSESFDAKQQSITKN